MNDAFSGYHPAVNFIFFVLAIGVGLFLAHPAFLCLSVFSAGLYYLLLTGRNGLRRMLPLGLAFLALAGLNPLLNPRGDTVLFTYFGGRTFTLESLCCGLVTGAAFVSVLLWFGCYNKVMTSDKFLYLFGWCIPAISLLLSMVLRLVPAFQAKAAGIAGVRKSIGKGPDCGDRRARVRNSVDILSVLTSWALEGAVVTADSMRSRGFGCGKRTSYAAYRPACRDAAAAGTLLAGLIAALAGVALGGAGAQFFPTLSLSGVSGAGALAWLGCAALLLLPSFLHIWEDASWHFLKSRI